MSCRTTRTTWEPPDSAASLEPALYASVLGAARSRRLRLTEGKEWRQVRVIDHDEDGDWVFLTGEELREESGDIVADELALMCLQDLVASHPEVHSCADLPLGHSAEYIESEHRWVWSALEPEE